MVKSHFKDSVCLSSRGKARERYRAVGSSGNPPSITDEPIIKDKLQYTSLGYANSKLDASHQKISVAIFCIYKLKMSAFRTGFNTNIERKEKHESHPSPRHAYTLKPNTNKKIWHFCIDEFLVKDLPLVIGNEK